MISNHHLNLASIAFLLLCGQTVQAQRARLPITITNAKAKAAQKAFEEEVAAATQRYAEKLDAISRELGGQGDADAAKQVSDHKKALTTHGISTTPDPLRRAKQTLLRSRFAVTDGARMQFLADGRVFNQFNQLFTYWAMHDPQTIIVGAANATKPLYIYKFERGMKRGIMLTYRPDSKAKKHKITRITAR